MESNTPQCYAMIVVDRQKSCKEEIPPPRKRRMVSLVVRILAITRPALSKLVHFSSNSCVYILTGRSFVTNWRCKRFYITIEYFRLDM